MELLHGMTFRGEQKQFSQQQITRSPALKRGRAAHESDKGGLTSKEVTSMESTPINYWGAQGFLALCSSLSATFLQPR